MDHFSRMRLFVRVVETGSFSGTAAVERVAQSTVSKEISALEARLGAQLIRRSSRGLSVTAQGQDFYEFAVGMLADLEAAEARIRSSDASPLGRIRVACPYVFSSRLIVPKLPALLARFPGLTIDMDVSERYVSLVQEGVDVAVRIGELADSSLVGRQIGSVEAVVVASPGYLEAHGTPQTPVDLERHHCLPFLFEGNSKTWKFRGPQREIVVAPVARLRTNDAEAVRVAVRAGLGMAQGPTWMFADDIADGTVVPVLDAYKPRLFPIHAIKPSGRRMTAAIRLFVDYMAEIIAAEPLLRIR